MATLPNWLTLLRILTIPVCVVLYSLPYAWAMPATAAVFVLAAITDWLDGYLARKWQQTSALGTFLDPIADKLLVATLLVLLVGAYHSLWLTLPAMVIIGREIVISALREWMALLGKQTQVAVSMLGKLKTTVQMIAITALLAFGPQHDQSWIALVLLQLSAVLTLWSMLLYLKAAWPFLQARRPAQS